jgi:hypothetical protein
MLPLPNTELKFWWPLLKDYLQNSKGFKDWRDAVVSDEFQIYLSDFLFDIDGGKFQKDFRDLIYQYTYAIIQSKYNVENIIVY